MGFIRRFGAIMIKPSLIGAISLPSTNTPFNPDINANIPELCYFWDAKGGYTSGDTWANQIVTPADGSAQTASDVWVGSGASPGSTAPTFDENHWNFDGGDYFAPKNANPTLMGNIHKGTSSWTIGVKIQTGSLLKTINTMIGTAATTGDYGFIFRSDSGGNVKFDQYNGVSLITKQVTAVNADTVYDLIVAYDHITNIVKIAVNSITWTEFSPSGWTITSQAASHNFCISANGGTNGRMASGVHLFGIWISNKCLTEPELSRAVVWMDNYYFPIVPDPPGQPERVVIQAQDEGASLAWVLQDDGGAVITNYVAQYKLSSEPTVWSTFSHTASGYPGITFTGLSNASSYDFRVAAVNVAGTGPFSTPVSATPTNFTTGPYDLTPYKITIPVNSAGNLTGTSAEITQPAFLTYTSAWFGKVGTDYVFNCPDGGATTSAGASYSRSELRDLNNIDASDPSEDELTFKVTACSTANGSNKVVCHQIHGFGEDDFPWIKGNFDSLGPGICKWRNLMQMLPSRDVTSIVTNGSFATDTDWTKGSGWSISGGFATGSLASTALSQTANQTILNGLGYTVSYTIVRTAGSVVVSVGGTAGTTRSTSGTFTETIRGGATQIVAITGTGFSGTITNVSVLPIAAQTITMASNITLEDEIVSKYAVVQVGGGYLNGGQTYLDVYYNGVLYEQITGTDMLPHTQQMFRETPYYYKRGNYYQSNARAGNICTVVHPS
jgi:hypothetical protein